MITIAIVYGKVDIFTIEVRKLYVRGKSDIGIGIPLLAGARAISWQPTAEREAVDAFCRNWDYNASTAWEKDANPARPRAAASHQPMPRKPTIRMAHVMNDTDIRVTDTRKSGSLSLESF